MITDNIFNINTFNKDEFITDLKNIIGKYGKFIDQVENNINTYNDYAESDIKSIKSDNTEYDIENDNIEYIKNQLKIYDDLSTIAKAGNSFIRISTPIIGHNLLERTNLLLESIKLINNINNKHDLMIIINNFYNIFYNSDINKFKQLYIKYSIYIPK